MESPTTVKQLFAPLGNRLYTFESNNYSSDYSDEFSDWEENIVYTVIIHRIVKVVDEFDPKEVYEESKFYLSRVEEIIKNIKPLTSIVIQFRDGDTKEKEVPEIVQKLWFKKWKEELEVYLKQLKAIQDIAAKRMQFDSGKIDKSTAKQNQQVTEINLPENFTVSQLNKSFEPQLTVNQAALFLYYLREHAVLPPYSDSSIGKLAEAFFVRNQKNVTKGLTDIYTIKSNEAELSSLKKVLQRLIKEIDNDLKNAR